jgi:DNA polymerase-3 subunit epsilon
MKILFYDLETTGVNPGKNGIHQISGQISVDGEIKETFNLHVRPNPKAIILQEALDVSGVTKEQILAYPEMGEVYHQLIAMLDKYVDRFNKTDKLFLAGYRALTCSGGRRWNMRQGGDALAGGVYFLSSAVTNHTPNLSLHKRRFLTFGKARENALKCWK